MFDPVNFMSISTWTDKDLVSLPNAEDDRHEYKSAVTRDNELAEKIARAASGFWNTGGGLFVAGVNGQAMPDGGVSLTVGRQSRRDWIDQVMLRVTPRAPYAVHNIEDKGAGLNIAAGNAVCLIGFGESEIGPHMAPDYKYYIRAGAHTVAAPHFIVEAIHARRGARIPFLRSAIRRKPGNEGVVQLGIVALSEVPAIDVEITLDPLPPFLEKWSAQKFPLHVPVINFQLPFYFDIHLLALGEQQRPTMELQLTYRDLSGKSYQSKMHVDIDRQMGPVLMGVRGTEDIERDLRDIRQALGKVADAVGKNESHLREIARKLR